MDNCFTYRCLVCDMGFLGYQSGVVGISLLRSFDIIQFVNTIIHAAKSFNGIQISFLSGNNTISELFSYENLIDMKINVSDLVEHPESYAVDMNGPVIVRTDS